MRSVGFFRIGFDPITCEAWSAAVARWDEEGLRASASPKGLKSQREGNIRIYQAIHPEGELVRTPVNNFE